MMRTKPGPPLTLLLGMGLAISWTLLPSCDNREQPPARIPTAPLARVFCNTLPDAGDAITLGDLRYSDDGTVQIGPCSINFAGKTPLTEITDRARELFSESDRSDPVDYRAIDATLREIMTTAGRRGHDKMFEGALIVRLGITGAAREAGLIGEADAVAMAQRLKALHLGDTASRRNPERIP